MESAIWCRFPPPSLTVKSDVKELTPAEVAEIVGDSLAEWLPGYTDYDEKTDSQWRISFLGHDRYRFEQAGRNTRVFRIAVAAREEK